MELTEAIVFITTAVNSLLIFNLDRRMNKESK